MYDKIHYKLKKKRKENRDFPDGTVNENPPANAGEVGLIPGLGKFHMPWNN